MCDSDSVCCVLKLISHSGPYPMACLNGKTTESERKFPLFELDLEEGGSRGSVVHNIRREKQKSEAVLKRGNV